MIHFICAFIPRHVAFWLGVKKNALPFYASF